MGVLHGCSEGELNQARTDKVEGFERKWVVAGTCTATVAQAMSARKSVAFALVFIK